MSITSARPEDTALVLQFIRGLAAYERLGHECVATEERVREELFGPNPTAEAVIARLNGQAAGFALYFHNFSTFLTRRGIYLEDLFVLPEFRGHGVGKALLAHLARLTVERNGGRLEWSVLDWNEPAIGFYRSIGAQSMDEWTVFRLTGDALTTLAGEAL